MFSKHIKSISIDSAFSDFNYRFLKCIEDAGFLGSANELIILIENRDRLVTFTNSLVDSDAKRGIQKILLYDESHYERLTSELVVKLKTLT